MIINLDVDGVVCDFAPFMFETLRKDGYDVDALDPEVYKVWDIFPMMPQDMRKHAFALCEDPNYWLKIPVISGAQESVAKLRAAGHRIHWITTSWGPCFGWADIRKSWLNKHFDCEEQNLSKDLTIAGDKSFSDADVFVDDKAASVRDWLSHFSGRKHTGILYTNSHNERDADEFPLKGTWDEGLADMIIEFGESQQ